VIDAGDSVNLMTIHAAKGLEFPVVFVVNLTRGTGGIRAALRVVADPVSGQGSLSVGGFQSEADEDVKGKNREETKRLLYVALTRARDRLYLASEVKDGKWRAFGGSLGEILPASFRVKFEAAAGEAPPETIEWIAASGQVHTLRVCQKQTSSERSNNTVKYTSPPVDRGPDLFDPLVDPFALPRASVTEVMAPSEMSDVGAGSEASHPTLAGTLVHRLFERRNTTLAKPAARGDTGGAAIVEELRHLLRDEESVETSDLESVLEQAGAAYRALCSQPALAAALDSGEPFFEVPFSFRPASSTMILRGTFDCLVRRRDGGGITVLELKTGKPSPQHEQQLSIYVTAARALFPRMVVDGTLVYASHGNLDDRPFDSNR
jgi:ATP-dependent helicase/nuclease subunit A